MLLLKNVFIFCEVNEEIFGLIILDLLINISEAKLDVPRKCFNSSVVERLSLHKTLPNPFKSIFIIVHTSSIKVYNRVGSDRNCDKIYRSLNNLKTYNSDHRNKEKVSSYPSILDNTMNAVKNK